MRATRSLKSSSTAERIPEEHPRGCENDSGYKQGAALIPRQPFHSSGLQEDINGNGHARLAIAGAKMTPEARDFTRGTWVGSNVNGRV